jgi:hypothetical protein
MAQPSNGASRTRTGDLLGAMLAKEPRERVEQDDEARRHGNRPTTQNGIQYGIGAFASIPSVTRARGRRRSLVLPGGTRRFQRLP